MQTREAQPTWVFIPTCFPATSRFRRRGKLHDEWGGASAQRRASSIPEMFDAAKAGKLKALYVVGANPVGRLGVGPGTSERRLRCGAGHVPDRNRGACGCRIAGGKCV